MAGPNIEQWYQDTRGLRATGATLTRAAFRAEKIVYWRGQQQRAEAYLVALQRWPEHFAEAREDVKMVRMVKFQRPPIGSTAIYSVQCQCGVTYPVWGGEGIACPCGVRTEVEFLEEAR